jgi:spore coat polysaccharide biosynthesis protein SpsF (cytidylyltransferase family)
LAGVELVGLGVATSADPHNDIIQAQCERYGYDCWRYSPEYDLAGRYLHVFERTNTTFALTLSGDSPLGYYNHTPAIMAGYRATGRTGTARWHADGRDPTLDSVATTLCAVGPAQRWQSRLQKALARTEDELEVTGFIVTRRPEEDFNLLVPIPAAAYVDMPEDYWSLHRWYCLEIDWPEDAVTLRIIYENLWDGVNPVDCAEAIDFIDTHPEYQYNRERKNSLVNQIVHGMEDERRKERYEIYRKAAGL